jgi:hypothetical protein
MSDDDGCTKYLSELVEYQNRAAVLECEKVAALGRAAEMHHALNEAQRGEKLLVCEVNRMRVLLGQALAALRLADVTLQVSCVTTPAEVLEAIEALTVVFEHRKDCENVASDFA